MLGLVKCMYCTYNTAMFKSLIFSMPGFALSYTTYMFILMILYNFCLLPIQLCYIIVYIWNAESSMQTADWCEPQKISNAVLNLVLQTLHFKK
jgi:hypothetical protein